MTAPDQKPELKPCPFCGRDAHHAKDAWEDYPIVMCVGCGIRSDGFTDKKKAAEEWNRRATPPETAIVGELRAVEAPKEPLYSVRPLPIGTGPTKTAAVLAAWRAATGEESQ